MPKSGRVERWRPRTGKQGRGHSLPPLLAELPRRVFVCTTCICGRDRRIPACSSPAVLTAAAYAHYSMSFKRSTWLQKINMANATDAMSSAFRRCFARLASRCTALSSSSVTTVTPITDALKQLYNSGTDDAWPPAAKAGQPQVVVVVTGGGGQLVGAMLSLPGASSCLLEAVCPYSKASCLSFLATHGRSAEGIGFCSEDMALQLALAARDRGMELEPNLARWPDIHGIASTATIVSGYQRRGGYRVHAAAANATGGGSSYTHTLVKGARDREEEDLTCALLTARALADSAGVSAARRLETYGVRRTDEAKSNAVGEVASGVEAIPVRVPRDAELAVELPNASYILIPRAQQPVGKQAVAQAVAAPKGRLPPDAVVLWCESGTTSTVKRVAEAAMEALKALGWQGDGKASAWGVKPSPVLIACADREGRQVFDPLFSDELTAMRPQVWHRATTNSGRSRTESHGSTHPRPYHLLPERGRAHRGQHRFVWLGTLCAGLPCRHLCGRARRRFRRRGGRRVAEGAPRRRLALDERCRGSLRGRGGAAAR